MLRPIVFSIVFGLLSLTHATASTVKINDFGGASWIVSSEGTNRINYPLDVRYGTSGYEVYNQSEVKVSITYYSTISYCAAQGYVPYTDTAPGASGAILFGEKHLISSQAFYIDATADDGYVECEQSMTDPLYRIQNSSAYQNACYYRYQHGFFDQYAYVTAQKRLLSGSAFYAGNFVQVKQNAEVGTNLTNQAIGPNENYYWNYDSVSYPNGQLYLVGMMDTAKHNNVARMDMPPTQESAFAERLGARLSGADGKAVTDMSAYDQLVVVCVAQSVMTFSPSAKPTQPVFVQGWKNLTWVQRHWYVPFVVIAVVVLVVLLIILVFCCCKKNERVQNRIDSTMVVRERVGKAYAYDEDSNDDDLTTMTTSQHSFYQ